MKVRVPPLAAAFALLAAALGATAWSTRSTVDDAFATVREGQALAVEQAVRADLADLGGPPESGDLDGILHEHSEAGLRYVATLDKNGRIEASAGQPLGELSERPLRALEVTHVGDRLRVEMRAAFRRAWGEGGRPWRIVLELEPVQAKQLRTAAERTLAIGIISALVLLAVAVALVRRELVRAAEARAREQERRLAALGEMSAVLAHEIKNPLASLKGNAQLLAASLPEGDKPRQPGSPPEAIEPSRDAWRRAKAERVVDEARRLEQLAQDLLSFVRSGELHRSEIGVAELVRVAAGETPIETTGDARWSLDGERMRQVLANIIANAGEAGPPPVRVAVHAAGGRLVIEVSDHGPGVPEADRERIFEPFFTNKTRGTGLGLAIARRIVTMHGGTIEVAGAPGGGALFRIELPG